MNIRHVLKWPLIGIVALLTAVLAFIGYDVFSTVFPDDGIVITASDGASLRVDGRALTVLTGHAGTTTFSPWLRPLTTGLFAVLAMFALIGAVSLFPGEMQTTQKIEPSAPPNGGPATRLGIAVVTERPPSVS